MPVTANAQTRIGEQVVEHDELEQALETREQAKLDAGEARKTYKSADEVAKALIAELELGEAPVRVGRFVIAVREIPARSVAFDTDPSTRLAIRVDAGPEE